MDSSSVTRRSTMAADFQKADVALAEWTNKIKAIQAQVDADEEAEQKRLEEEIAASRLARLRRSRDMGNPDSLQTAPNPGSPRTPDRRSTQTDPQRHLARVTPATPERGKQAPVSLAAFIGGRATGPRLNKPVPQPDSHDPTQFEQRAGDALHPVFGSGGVAMPGIATKRHSMLSGEQERNGASSERVLEIRHVHGAVIPRSEGERSRQQKASVFEHENRQRTVSTPDPFSPSPPTPTKFGASIHGQTSQPSFRKTSTQMHMPSASSTPVALRSLTPRQHTTPAKLPLPSPSVTTPSLARRILPDPKPPIQGPNFLASYQPSPAFLRPPPPKDPTPSISRLQGRGFVQNMVKVSTQLEAAATTSPTRDSPSRRRSGVSERRLPAETPTNSSAVNARQRTSASELPPGAFTDSTNEPRSAVPLVNTKSLPVQSSTARAEVDAVPASGPRRKSLVGVDAPPFSQWNEPREPRNGIAAHEHEPTSGRRTPRRKSVSQVGATPQDDAPSLGSSQTLISYVKANKTGDNPVTSRPPSVPPPPEVDELGFRPSYTGKSQGMMAVSKTSGAATRTRLPPSTGSPLSHPTKARARRPKRYGLIKPDSSSKSAISSEDSFPSPNSARFSGTQTTLQKYPTPSQENAERSYILAPRLTDRPPSPASPEQKTTEQNVSKTPLTSTSGKLVGAFALPGMSKSTTPQPTKPSPAPSPNQPAERRALPGLATTVSPSPARTEERSPQSPPRHTRIPSTGNRRTVMEVAEALNHHQSPLTLSPGEEEGATKAAMPTPAPRARQLSQPPAPAERRKSSYEKYSAIILPPLKEEATPTPSPVSTLSRDVKSRGLGSESNTLSGDSIQLVTHDVKASTPDPSVVHFNHPDEPLPRVDVQRLIAHKGNVLVQESDALPISVDVLSVAGNMASTLERDTNVFYDTEALAIVYRSKSRNSGLVSTRVWGWQGRRCKIGEREERKLQDLARRYGTPLELIYQFSEPELLVHVLGGQLASRQGARAHWTSENTTMHVVRCRNGLIYIDEQDLNIKNLCSGYSYCVTILDTVYVWHGCGSLERERQAAVAYAGSMAGGTSSVVELQEGQSYEEQEMFWMILGDEEYTKADYWRWRPKAGCESRILRVDAGEVDAVCVLGHFGSAAPDESVLILDCVWELFVLVGIRARNKRRDIRLALDVAMRLSKGVADSRPYPPNVHVLILPSQVPLDPRCHFRDLDVDLINGGTVPDHMNLLTYTEAVEHLEKDVWDRAALRDRAMLPLGLDPSDVA